MNNKAYILIGLIFSVWAVAVRAAHNASPGKPQSLILQARNFQTYVTQFNQNDQELYAQHIPNASAWEFLENNVPLFECPDKELEEIYYFRWWTYRKHLKQTPDGFVITEFLPSVGWAGKHNTISCAVGHHFYEGRWLHNEQFLNDYSTFWFRKGGEPRRYSFWAADALWARHKVAPNRALLVDLLPDLIANYEAWEKSNRDVHGLFWQIDGQDGMEVSIGGSGYRATINSYMYGDALAIANIADLAARGEIAARFRKEAARIKTLVEEKLWDEAAQFFKVAPRLEGGTLGPLAMVRELHGLTPWYFHLPDRRFALAWKQLFEPQGFLAPYGPTTAEQRHPGFKVAYEGHECQWNGPSWPYSTAVTLTALANLINDQTQDYPSAQNYYDLLRTYTRSHHLKLPDGRTVPWIDENLNPQTGDWIARTLLQQRQQKPVERGKDYNHSTFCDLVISGLVGLRPRADEIVEVNPLIPVKTWDYFCLDQIRYHGHWLTILYDKTGQQYNKGAGLRIFADGRQIAQSDSLARLTAPLPSSQTSSGWMKHPASPVMGGQYGTCFDVSVLKEEGGYRMWLSWRPKASVAVVESRDGIHWNEPPRVVLGPRKESGWEDDINRPIILKKGSTYHMWYTGQARDRSWIGYATSADGLKWRRMSDKPVLSPEQSWEKVAVMCPHVLWDESAGLFRAWYSGGDQYEPDAIGYATSPDGLHWTKYADNPIFKANPAAEWEQHKVTACQVIPQPGGYLMFYIGFRDIDHAQIGMAFSKDGISQWQRHSGNPIIRPGYEQWDHDACYKPFAVFDGQRWLLWYNGRRGNLEQIGLAIHEGKNLGF